MIYPYGANTMPVAKRIPSVLDLVAVYDHRLTFVPSGRRHIIPHASHSPHYDKVGSQIFQDFKKCVL